jgi:hypothetical protein
MDMHVHTYVARVVTTTSLYYYYTSNHSQQHHSLSLSPVSVYIKHLT